MRRGVLCRPITGPGPTETAGTCRPDALIHSSPFGHTVQEEQLIEPHLKGTQYFGVELVHRLAAIGGHNAPQGDLPLQHAIEQRGGKSPVPGGIQGIEPGFCHQIGIGRLAHHL